MGGLSLSHVGWLALLGAALPLVLLYVLKAKPKRVRVASLWLWSAARRDLHARTPWQKLRREPTLVLELLALALGALALAGPTCRGRALGGAHVALVLDVSASMRARDAATGRPRIELAREAALRLLDGLAPGAEAMLVTAGRNAAVVRPLGRDLRGLREAVRGLDAQEVEGAPDAAVALAVDRLRALGGTRRVVLVTDGGAPAEAPALRAGAIAIETVRVGTPTDNTGVLRFDVRAARRGRERGEVQAFALLAHFGREAREVYATVRLEDDTSALASRRLRLEPGRREALVLAFPYREQDAGKGLVLELSPGDALEADDRAYGRVPPGPQLPVALVPAAGGSPWLRRALESDPDATVQVYDDTTTALREAPEGALLVFDGACPERSPAGHDVLAFAPPAASTCVGVPVGAAVDGPTISSYVTTDARFRFLTLDELHLVRATPLQLRDPGAALVNAGDSVLVADASLPDRSSTVVGFDVADSDWPLRASFVLFVRNVEELARAHRTRPVLGGGRTGEPLRVAVPETVRAVSAQGPAGPLACTVTAGTAVLGETQRAGLYRLRWAGGGAVAPVNLLAESESDLRSARLRVEGGATVTDVRALVRPHEELAPWLAALVALALAANVYFVTRGARRARTLAELRAKPALEKPPRVEGAR